MTVLSVVFVAVGCGNIWTSDHNKDAKRFWEAVAAQNALDAAAAKAPTIHAFTPRTAVIGATTQIEVDVTLPGTGYFVALVYGVDNVKLLGQSLVVVTQNNVASVSSNSGNNPSSNSSFRISGTVPPPPVGFPPQKVDMVILDPQGSVVATFPKSDTKAFELVLSADPTPVVDFLAPALGPTAGGTPVTLTGSGFKTGATVTIGGKLQGTIVVVNGNRLTFVTTPNVSGKQDVVVTNLDKQSAALANGYEFTGASAAGPSLTSVTPNAGTTAGGTNVTIVGSGFIAGSTFVTFNGTAATSVVVTSPTSLTCNTPPGAVGLANVVVGNGFGTQSGSLYTYQTVPTATTYFTGNLVFTPIPSGILAGGFQITGSLTPTAAAAAAGVVQLSLTITPPSSGGGTNSYTVTGTNLVTLNLVSVGPCATVRLDSAVTVTVGGVSSTVALTTKTVTTTSGTVTLDKP